MTYLIIPKTTLAAVSKAFTMPTRTVASSPEIADGGEDGEEEHPQDLVLDERLDEARMAPGH
jgi:hypothetical protein